jgi:hypothetical protein
MKNSMRNAALLVLVLSCAVLTAADKRDPHARDGCSIDARASQLTLSPAQSVDVTVRFRNVNRKLLSVVTSSVETDFDWTVYGPDGDLVPMTRYENTIVNRIQRSTQMSTLLPGQEINEVLGDIGRRFDMSEDGPYTIWAHKLVGSSLNDGGIVEIWSNPITIVVTHNARVQQPESPTTEP